MWLSSTRSKQGKQQRQGKSSFLFLIINTGAGFSANRKLKKKLIVNWNTANKARTTTTSKYERTYRTYARRIRKSFEPTESGWRVCEDIQGKLSSLQKSWKMWVSLLQEHTCKWRNYARSWWGTHQDSQSIQTTSRWSDEKKWNVILPSLPKKIEMILWLIYGLQRKSWRIINKRKIEMIKSH